MDLPMLYSQGTIAQCAIVQKCISSRLKAASVAFRLLTGPCDFSIRANQQWRKPGATLFAEFR